MRNWRRGLHSGRAVALVDQVLSGLSNFLAVALIARSGSPVDFGQFAVGYTAFIGILSFTRRLWGTRLAMTSAPEQVRVELKALLGATVVVLPLAVAILLVPSFVITGGGTISMLLVLTAALPVVIAQDLCRYAAVAAGKPAVAAVSDLIWVVAVVAGYAVGPPMLVALAIWAGGALAALVVAVIGLRVLPSIAKGWRIIRSRHATSEVSAVATVTSSLATYATLGLANLALGASATGTLRGAPTVMAPVNALFMFAGLAMLPMVFRAAERQQTRLVAQMAGLLVLASVGWGGVLLLLPTWAGQLLLGETWTGARSVLPWTTVEYVGLAIGAGAALGLQARESARMFAIVSLVKAVLVVICAGLAAVWATSAQGFAAGLAAASLINAALVAVLYRREVKQPKTRRAVPLDSAAGPVPPARAGATEA